MWAFIWFYAALSGLGQDYNQGSMYMLPMVCSWEYFLNRKGLLTGIVTGIAIGAGCGTFRIETLYGSCERYCDYPRLAPTDLVLSSLIQKFSNYNDDDKPKQKRSYFLLGSKNSYK